jgi:hypothetical protein
MQIKKAAADVVSSASGVVAPAARAKGRTKLAVATPDLPPSTLRTRGNQRAEATRRQTAISTFVERVVAGVRRSAVAAAKRDEEWRFRELPALVDTVSFNAKLEWEAAGPGGSESEFIRSARSALRELLGENARVHFGGLLTYSTVAEHSLTVRITDPEPEAPLTKELDTMRDRAQAANLEAAVKKMTPWLRKELAEGPHDVARTVLTIGHVYPGGEARLAGGGTADYRGEFKAVLARLLDEVTAASGYRVTMVDSYKGVPEEPTVLWLRVRKID